MKTCSLPNCENKHEGKGYCKKHYRSYLRYGDPLHVQNMKEEQAEKKKQKEILKQQKANRIKLEVCAVEGCTKKTKAKGLCDMHLKRLERTGSFNSLIKVRNKIETDTCLAIGCDNPHKRHGFCSTHLIYIREQQTPYKARIVKLCGVPGCDNIHVGKGLCIIHYNEWKRVVRDYKLDY